MPVFVVPGNHDRRENFRAGLGHLSGVTEHPDFIQYAVDDYPVRLVMLDSVVPEAGHGLLCPERMAFLDKTLSASPNKPTMLVLHHPPMLTGAAGMDGTARWSASSPAIIIARSWGGWAARSSSLRRRSCTRRS
jgi:Icc protein